MVVALLSACSTSPNIGRSASTSEAPCEVTVGVVRIAEGVPAAMSRSAEAGFDTWLEQTRGDGGVNGRAVSSISRTVGASADAGRAAQELVDAGASLIITPVSSDASVAAGKVAVPAGVPAISWAGTSPTIVESVGRGMFSNGHSDRAQGQALADYARAQGYGRALTVRGPETLFTDGLPKFFTESFAAGGGTAVGEELFRFGQTDFSSVVSRVKSSGADVLVTAAYGPELTNLLTQLRAAGITTPVIGADGAVDPAVAALPAAEGLAYTSYVVADPARADGVSAAITERSGVQDFPMTSLLGYEMGLVLDDAIASSASCSPRDLGLALAEVSGVPGLTGTVTFAGGDGMAVRDMTVVQVRDGAVVPVFTRPAGAD